MKLRQTLIVLLLAIGLGSWYYVYEIKGRPAREMAKEEAKRVFKGVDTDKVLELALKHSGGMITLKKFGPAWRLMYPKELDSDGAAVSAVLTALKNLNVEETVDAEGANLKEFGLDERLESVTFATGSNTAQTLVFGIDNPTAQYSYAHIEGQKPVFMVLKYQKNNILKNVNELRDKKVLSFDTGQAVKVASPYFSASKDTKGDWQLAGHGRAAQDVVTAWLQQLHDLQVEQFSAEDGKPDSVFGIHNPSGRYQVWLKDAVKPITLLRGKSLGKGKGSYFAVQGKPLVFTLPEAVSSNLDRKLSDLIPTPALKPSPTAAPSPQPKK